MKRTARGFAMYTALTDSRGANVRVQRSSEMGARRVWIFTKGGSTIDNRIPPSERDKTDTASYLSPKQARQVAAALLRFAEGEE